MGRKKRTPGICERGNKWIVNTTYKGQRLWDTCATFEMAETNLRKIMTLIDEGRYLEKERQPKDTLAEFAARYMEWCRSTGQKAVDSKENCLRNLVARIGGETRLSKLTRADIEKYQADRLTTPGGRKSLVGKATVNRDTAVLRHLLSKAVEWKVLDENPARCIKKFKEVGRRLRYLTPDEIQQLLDACSPTMRDIVILALHTGMRKSEILNLIWDNVNLRERFIELLDQKNGERSTIPLNQTAIDTLRSIPCRLYIVSPENWTAD